MRKYDVEKVTAWGRVTYHVIQHNDVEHSGVRPAQGVQVIARCDKRKDAHSIRDLLAAREFAQREPDYKSVP